jgi:hypothetical protein
MKTRGFTGSHAAERKKYPKEQENVIEVIEQKNKKICETRPM